MTALFWCSLAFVLYTFVGYPFLLWVLSRGRAREPRRSAIWPKVSLIIAVHNAAKIISEKLHNTLQLDYPRDRLEIIVASDGSQDDTGQVVASFAEQGVQFVEISRREGKHYAQMQARDVAGGEILVFTDAAVLLHPSSLRRMVENFADPTVGVVSSVDDVGAMDKHGAAEASYVQGEMGLRGLESSVGSMVSVSGSYFGARRQVCQEWHPGCSSDFFVPLHAVAQGFRVVMDPECRARFAVVRSERAEFQRKIRTIVHGIEVLVLHLELLNPFRYGRFAWQLASHKLFRWLLPFALAALLFSNLRIYQTHPLYAAFLALQVCGYGTGLLALALENRARFRPLRWAAFFLIGNAATLVAWVKFSLGEKYVVWEPSQRT